MQSSCPMFFAWVGRAVGVGIFLILAVGGMAHGADLAALVNPFVGTAAGGDTYPGATVPFGMVALSPDMQNGYYTYQQNKIVGFSTTHLSGAGCPSDGDVFFTATTGPVRVQPKNYCFTFSHQREGASPGYYRVFMKTWGIKAQLTATTRCGMAKFTFPAGRPANVLIPISHTVTGTVASNIHILDNRTITGSVTSLTFCNTNRPYTVYFVMKFNRPFKSFGVWKGRTVVQEKHNMMQASGNGRLVKSSQPGDLRIRDVRLAGAPIGAYTSWPAVNYARVLEVRIGISYVSVGGAEKNLAAEIPRCNFSAVHSQAHARWNKALAVITVHGGTLNRRKIFYTALYHALLLPNVFDDVDGRYIGYDNKIHHVPAGHRHIYANWSGWDIYRSEMPLLTITEPQRAQDMAQSVVEMAKQLGYIDRWPEANRPTGCMNGHPLTNCLVEIWQAGLHHFDIKAAYRAMIQQCFPNYLRGHADLTDQGAYQDVGYQRYGVISPADANVASAEENDIAFSALGHLARGLGKKRDADVLFGDALQYTSMYNPTTKFMQRRNSQGAWMPLNKNARDAYNYQFYCEGSAWEYDWLVPEDMYGLIELMGGNKGFSARLQRFFADGHYDPTNEPDVQSPFLFDYCRQPWRSQYWVATNADTSYRDTPNGLAWSKLMGTGNDDCGEMSAWYVLSQIGLYQVDPSHPDFEITTPRFPKITIYLQSPHPGKTFIIATPNGGGKNRYIQSATLDGTPLSKPWLPERMVFQGGIWNVIAGTAPNKNWGAAHGDGPPSLSGGPVKW